MPYLPDELMLRILDEFTISDPRIARANGQRGCQDSVRTLHSLCLVTRDFHRLTESYLYRAYMKPDSNHVSIIKDNYIGSVTHTSRLTIPPNKSLRQFINRLIDRPDLAQHVEYISLDRWRNESSPYLDDDFQESPPTCEKAKLFNEAAAQSRVINGVNGEAFDGTIRSRLGWLDSLEAGNEDAEIALLLALTPNLAQLAITLPDGTASGIQRRIDRPHFSRRVLSTTLAALATSPASSGLPLMKLEHLTVSGHKTDGGTGFELDAMSHFLQLPSLRTLRAEAAVAHHERNNACNWGVGIGQSKLTHVQLDGSLFDARALETILASCPLLETFELRFGDQDNRGEYRIDFTRLGEALRLHCRGLKKLVLDPTKYDWRDRRDAMEPPWGRLGSLTALRRLEELWVVQDALIGSRCPGSGWEYDVDVDRPDSRLVDILPSSLKCLTLGKCNMRIVSQLERVSEVLEIRFPALEVVDVDMDYGQWGRERIVIGREKMKDMPALIFG